MLLHSSLLPPPPPPSRVRWLIAEEQAEMSMIAEEPVPMVQAEGLARLFLESVQLLESNALRIEFIRLCISLSALELGLFRFRGLADSSMMSDTHRVRFKQLPRF